MKKIMLAILSLMILAGCGLVPTTKEQIKIPDIHTGLQGITLEFLQNAPPAEVYQESYFDIILKTHNQGAKDITGGMLVIGVEDQNVELQGEKDKRFDLQGKSVYNPEGAFDMMEFKAFARKLGPTVSRSYTTTITATACYQYETDATAIMCIDTDILGTVKNKPCTTSSQGYGSGQGGPVTITSVTPKMLPHADPEYIIPEFTININNQGGGDVIASQKVYEACTGKQTGRESWNQIKIQAELSDQYLQCTPETITLKTGGSNVVCSLPGGINKARGTHTAPLSIKLEYGYMTRKIKSMTITKPVSD